MRGMVIPQCAGPAKCGAIGSGGGNKDMFSKKQTIILIVLILVLIGAIFLFQQKYDKWPWQKVVSVSSPTTTASPTLGGSAEEETDLRQIVMKDVAAKIGQLAPTEPVLGGQWFVTRFWFIDGSYATLYAEYEDGHILRQILLTADTSQAPKKLTYKVDAYFEAGESGWLLKSGKDQESNLPLILFEFDQSQNKWARKN